MEFDDLNSLESWNVLEVGLTKAPGYPGLKFNIIPDKKSINLKKKVGKIILINFLPSSILVLIINGSY